MLSEKRDVKCGHLGCACDPIGEYALFPKSWIDRLWGDIKILA